MNQQKREDIINAMIELVSVHGFHNAPMAMIAERANVATGTIYRFFESKDDLISKTYICLEQRMIASILESYPETQSIHEQFQHVCKELVNYFLLSPMEFRFVQQFFNSPYGTATRRGRIEGDCDIILSIFKRGNISK